MICLFICEKCGKEHDGSFGSGRFCSKSCANSRKHTEESRLKTSKSLLSYYENHEHVNKGKIFNPNSERVKRKLQILSGEYVPKRVRKPKKKEHILNTMCLGNNYMAVIKDFTGYVVDVFGNIFDINSGKRVKTFNSSGYIYAVVRRDSDGKLISRGVHQLTARAFLDSFFDGCVVHHVDENKTNNFIGNLVCMSIEDHARLHADPSYMIKYVKENGPANKGMKMSDEFSEKCIEGRKKSKLRQLQGDR